MKLIIDDKPYILNVSRAIEYGVLAPAIEYAKDIRAGDVFQTHPSGNIVTNPFLVVRSQYPNALTNTNDAPCWMLLGIGCGANSNSGPFFSNGARTKAEVLAYLKERQMVFVRNIDNEVASLVNKKKN
jgi:hypothetical protein